eukprot:TRINITY_DN45350_c0_g1_i1.p1 TRINITY_DN45350_c0_g1~~TRINITY_DN45350_c0_g1_i1.p1  ORF type:complete len:234 (-),score=39.79 TRINITY_DN45350_c0_g1_i1:75-776(-)
MAKIGTFPLVTLILGCFFCFVPPLIILWVTRGQLSDHFQIDYVIEGERTGSAGPVKKGHLGFTVYITGIPGDGRCEATTLSITPRGLVPATVNRTVSWGGEEKLVAVGQCIKDCDKAQEEAMAEGSQIKYEMEIDGKPMQPLCHFFGNKDEIYDLAAPEPIWVVNLNKELKEIIDGAWKAASNMMLLVLMLVCGFCCCCVGMCLGIHDHQKKGKRKQSSRYDDLSSENGSESN